MSQQYLPIDFRADQIHLELFKLSFVSGQSSQFFREKHALKQSFFGLQEPFQVQGSCIGKIEYPGSSCICGHRILHHADQVDMHDVKISRFQRFFNRPIHPPGSIIGDLEGCFREQTEYTVENRMRWPKKDRDYLGTILLKKTDFPQFLPCGDK